tara:strand:+ start:13827 stop:14111 length:285 start_codon:yes stop_codon:yes gene_type:complete
MKSICFIISLIPLALGAFVWGKDGWRLAFWQTSVAKEMEVPIVEGMPELGTQTQVVWQEQFISGIESPLIGLLLSLILSLTFILLLRKKNDLSV